MLCDFCDNGTCERIEQQDGFCCLHGDTLTHCIACEERNFDHMASRYAGGIS